MGVHYNQVEVSNMKKMIFKFLVTVFICGLLFSVFNSKKPRYREFEFRGGLTCSNGGYVTSISHVLVNERDVELEELYERIYNQFILMNDEPDELTLYLYDSKKNLDEFNSFSSRYYQKRTSE